MELAPVLGTIVRLDRFELRGGDRLQRGEKTPFVRSEAPYAPVHRFEQSLRGFHSRRGDDDGGSRNS